MISLKNYYAEIYEFLILCTVDECFDFAQHDIAENEEDERLTVTLSEVEAFLIYTKRKPKD